MDGCILSGIKAIHNFSDVAVVFEYVDCCISEEIKCFLQDLLEHRKLMFENFYIPLNEILFIASLNDTDFINENLKDKSTIIYEKDLNKSEFYVVPEHIHDTLSLEAFQYLFGVIRNHENYMFNISNINENIKSDIISELNSIFEKALIKKSFSSLDFASIVESEIEEALPSYQNLNKWLSKSSHPTKKVLCYAGDAMHFTLLNEENIQLQFFKTNEKIVLKQNNTNFISQMPFQFLPNLGFNVHRGFISADLLENINKIIDNVFVNNYDKRTFSELSLIISKEITKFQQKPWECFITNDTKNIYKTFFPAEFIHYLLPSLGLPYSIIVYRQILSPRIKHFHLKHKATITGTFLDDILQSFGRKALVSLVTNDKTGLKKSLTDLFQTEAFTLLSGFSIEGFEYYKNNFILKNYVFISCNDISMLAFS
uniref:Uncharacterized protein n=1 Tax=Panagrolaimus sp. PS1159 TaxID=55785 RepID=A0AC35FE02_9BILA